MILYDNSSQFRILLTLTGSVIPQSIPVGVLSGVIGLCLGILRWMGKTEEWLLVEDYIKDPFAIQTMAMIIGYLLVVRTNMALNRWMDGISDVQTMLSKWADAFTSLNGFFAGKTDSESRHRVMMFRVRVAHWFSLMSCLAFATLRCGSLTSLRDVPIRELITESDAFNLRGPSKSFAASRSNSNLGSTRGSVQSTAMPNSLQKGLSGLLGGEAEPGLNKQSSFGSEASNKRLSFRGNAVPLNKSGSRSSALADMTKPRRTGIMDTEGLRSMELYVLSTPTAEEVHRLNVATDKVNTVCLWIIQSIMLEVRAKTLDAPAPIVTRAFQELSNGMLGFKQAHKIALVPFAFPFAQLVSILLVMLYVVLPFYVDSFTKNIIATPIISFLIPMCYCGLNCIAIELEEPFGTDWNDVDLDVRHEGFLWLLVDVLRAPSAPPNMEIDGSSSASGGEQSRRLEEKIRRNVSRGLSEVCQRRTLTRFQDLKSHDIVALSEKRETEQAARQSVHAAGNDDLEEDALTRGRSAPRVAFRESCFKGSVNLAPGATDRQPDNVENAAQAAAEDLCSI